MSVTTTPPQIVITNIGDADKTPEIVDVNDTSDNSNATGVGPTPFTQPPAVDSGASVLPPPSSTTAIRTTTPTTMTTAKTEAPASSTTTENISSSPNTTITQKDSSQIECPDLFTVSNKEHDDSNRKIKDDHHHTIIINNRNKAVIFDHKNKNRGDDVSENAYRNHSYGNVNSRERTPGAIVTAICSHGSVPLTVTFLECQANGKWNGTLPHCQGSLDISSNTLYFSVIGGVCGATILILALLYFFLMKTRRRDKGPVSPPLDPDKAIYVDPYAVGERLYSIPAPVHYTRGDITYAKPQIYGTYLNPSFYEDSYQRWRRQEQQVSEKLYDSPFINTRSSHQWGDNQDQAWTMGRGDKHVDNNKLHIPRAKISPMDQGSVRSRDSVSTLTFTGPRPQRHLYGRSTSIVSTNSTMPRYGNGHVPRRQNSILEPPLGLHLVKAFDDAPPPTFQELEVEYLPDGRTPF